MKHCIGLLFFILVFSRCSEVEEAPPSFALEQKPHSSVPAKQKPQINKHASEKDTFSEKKTFSLLEYPKKRKKIRIKSAETSQKRIYRASSDSTFIRRLNYLRSGKIELDFNEPVNKQFLISPVENQPFQSMITLSRESILRINFDNDILDYTDRFYTNGIKVDLISPGLQMNPLAKLMVPYWGSGKNYHGLTLVQNMFTPSTTKTGGILYGDRPYAAYLYVGSFKITNDPVKHFRQTSELDLGIMGPNSYGEWVQQAFHNTVPTNNEPLGWEYQIKNDLVLNYSIAYEKGLFMKRNIDLVISSVGNIGTLYTNFSGGIQLRTGWMNPYFANLGVAKRTLLQEQGLRKFQCLFFIKMAGKLVGYDATLEGGLLNRSSVYTIPAGEISRVVFQGSGGISISSGGFRLDVEQFLLSPDFHDGWWHKWVHVSFTCCL